MAHDQVVKITWDSTCSLLLIRNKQWAVDIADILTVQRQGT